MATAWIDTDRRQPRFAALQYIDNCYWLVHGELAPAPVTGMLRLRRFTIEPWKHDREVTGGILRKLRPADIRNHALARISADVGVDEFRNLSDEERRARRELARSAVAPARRGRRGYDAEHWRIITRAYLEIAATPGQ